MRITTTILAVACMCVALVSSVPVPDEGLQSQALDRLMVVEADNESALRSKRTIGLLRSLFPDVSKMIEDKVNNILGEVFKAFGPVVFQSLLGGNRNAGGGNGAAAKTTGTTVDVKNPYGDDDDDDLKSFVDDDDFFSKPADDKNSSKISFDLPTVKSEDNSSSMPMSTTPIPTESGEETTVAVTEKAGY